MSWFSPLPTAVLPTALWKLRGGAGAKGGTVILARRVGYEDDQNLLGFTLQPEKEIIAILVPKEDRSP